MSLPTKPSFVMIRQSSPISELGVIDLPSTHFKEQGRILIDGGPAPTATLSITLDLAHCDIPPEMREVLQSESSFETLSVEARGAMLAVLEKYLPTATEIQLEDKFFTISLLVGIPLVNGSETTIKDIRHVSDGMESVIVTLLTPWSISGEPYLYEEVALMLMSDS